MCIRDSDAIFPAWVIAVAAASIFLGVSAGMVIWQFLMHNQDTLLALLVGCLLGLVYLFPTLVATARQHPRRTPIFLLNIIFGWTLFGWGIALVWAYTSSPPEV